MTHFVKRIPVLLWANKVSVSHGSSVLWDNIIKMVSGTDEPLSVGSDEPYFSMQTDINIGICTGSDIRSLCRT